APAAAVAAICSLGASIVGPAVLTTEYEPTPRAFAVPLLIGAIGLTAHRRYWSAGIFASVALVYHPPTALPFLLVFLALVALRRDARGARPLLGAALLLGVAAVAQGGEGQAFFTTLAPLQEKLQRLRAPYVWISEWPSGLVLHYSVLAAILAAAYVRVRGKVP